MGGFGGGALEQPRRWAARPVGRPLYPWECRAAQSRQACPEEAQEPSWGAAAKVVTLIMLGSRTSAACLRRATCQTAPSICAPPTPQSRARLVPRPYPRASPLRAKSAR